MAAGTQGFTDTRVDTNHIGSVISKILEARKLAEDERKYAEAQANKYQTSLEEAGINKGYFFKKALRWKFGEEYKEKKISQLKTWKTKSKILKTAITGRAGQNKLNKFERAQAVFDMFQASDKPKTFRDKFKPLYEGYVDDPLLRPQSKLVGPSSAEKVKKTINVEHKKRVSKEDILTSIIGITQAIEKVSESISEKNKIVADQMIHSSVLQGMIHQQLKATGDSLDDKLQKLVDAISNQSQTQKKIIQKVSQAKAENKIEAQRDAASVVNFDNLLTKENESKIPATSAQDIEFQQMAMYEQNDVPKAETGAIFSGPDSGYLVELHGNEAVVPIDNNYTQGEPSAIDGKIRQKPNNIFSKSKTSITNNVQKFETGTKNNVSNNIFSSVPKYEKGNNKQSEVNSTPITSKFGFDTARNQMGIASGGTTQDSKLAQSMVDVMSLPMIAAGGAILSATTKYVQSIGEDSSSISPEIEKVSRPIAKTFGLPPSIVNKAKQDYSAKPVQEDDLKENGQSKRDLFAKLTEGFSSLLEKLKDNINTNGGGGNDDPGGGGNGPGGSGQDFSTLATIAALESGSAQGQADVAQSVYNRLADKTYGSSITDILTRQGQYQVAFKDPKASSGAGTQVADVFKNIKDEDSAVKAIMYYFNARGQKITEERARKLYQNSAKAISDPALQAKAAKHVGGRTEFLSSGQYKAGDAWRGGGSDNTFFARYGSGNQMSRGAVAAPSGLFNKPTSPTASNKPSQLGQAITSNYGLKVGEERQFTHPTYGVIKAHKTAVGFDFYKGMTKLDVSSSNSQGKSIVDYFISTNGGTQTFKPPASNQNSSQNVSSMSSKNKSESNQIAMLNINAGQKSSVAGSTPQVSGHNGTESGANPTKDFYNNPFSIGVG